MRNFSWNRFPIKNLLIDSLLTPIVESTYVNICNKRMQLDDCFLTMQISVGLLTCTKAMGSYHHQEPLSTAWRRKRVGRRTVVTHSQVRKVQQAIFAQHVVDFGLSAFSNLQILAGKKTAVWTCKAWRCGFNLCFTVLLSRMVNRDSQFLATRPETLNMM